MLSQITNAEPNHESEPDCSRSGDDIDMLAMKLQIDVVASSDIGLEAHAIRISKSGVVIE